MTSAALSLDCARRPIVPRRQHARLFLRLNPGTAVYTNFNLAWIEQTWPQVKASWTTFRS